MRTLRLRSWIAIIASLLVGCRSPYYADRGAAVGGLAGAGLGAAIGEAHDQPAAGALIGSAVGAVTGSVIGNDIDRQRAREDATAAQRAEQLAGRTTFQEIVAMSQAGLSDNLISNHIYDRGVAQTPTAQDLVSLKSNGVSDGVLREIQRIAATGARSVEPPVVVEQHVIAHPVPAWHPGWRASHHRHVRRGPRVGWGVSIWQ